MVVSFHPVIPFMFFAGAIVLCVLTDSLLWQAMGFLCAGACYLCLRGRRAWPTIALMLPLALVVTAVNPLFNLRGDTVLFMVLGSRPYTAEALAYGATTGMMVASVLLWFLSFDVVMTSDRLVCLFGRWAPILTLMFTMVLRLIPTYQREAKEIDRARRGIGRSPSSGTVAERLHSALDEVSALVSSVLEGSISTTDSMRSRGFGTGRRTSFARQGLTSRDALALTLMALLFAVALGGILGGAGTMGYFPSIAYPSVDGLGWASFLSFLGFLLSPILVKGEEVVLWSISRSRI